MYKYEESLVVNHPISKVYELVSNVERYPEFIPWCENVELLNTDREGYHYYKITIKFGIITQYFVTKDLFSKNEKIDIELVEGPFKFLHSIWKFKEIDNNSTLVDFFIEFEFKNPILNKMLGKVFLEANKQILNSFLKRVEKHIV